MQNHEYLQHRFKIVEANLDVVNRTLDANGITFTVEEDGDKTSTSLLIKKFCWKLSSVYMGTIGDNKINIGIKISSQGVDTHSTTDEER